MITEEQVLAPEFDEVLFLQRLLHTGRYKDDDVTASLQQLVTVMDGRISTIMETNLEDVKQHSFAVYQAEQELKATLHTAESLSKARDRVRLMLEKPYELVRVKLAELGVTKDAVQLLRAASRFMSLAQRLEPQPVHTSSTSGSNISSGAKADVAFLLPMAAALREIDVLVSETPRLNGIHMVARHLPLVEKKRAQLRTSIHQLLDMNSTDSTTATTEPPPAAASSSTSTSTLTSESVMNIGTAIMCAHTSHSSLMTTQEFMSDRRRLVLRRLAKDLQPQHILQSWESSVKEAKRVKKPPPTLKDALLQQLQLSFSFTASQTRFVVAYWRVLLSKVDIATRKPYLTHLREEYQSGRSGAAGAGAAAAAASGGEKEDEAATLVSNFLCAVLDKYREALLTLQGLQGQTMWTGVWESSYGAFMALLHQLLGSSPGSGSRRMVGGSGSLADCVQLLQVLEVASSSSAVAWDSVLRLFQTSFPPSLAHTFFSNWVSDVSRLVEQSMTSQYMAQLQGRLKPTLAEFYGILELAQSNPQQVVPLGSSSGGESAATAAGPSRDVLDAGALNHMKTLRDSLTSLRADPYAFSLHAHCLFESCSHWHESVVASLRRFPLPPLPSVTGGATRSQLTSVCAANMATVMLGCIQDALKDVLVLGVPYAEEEDFREQSLLVDEGGATAAAAGGRGAVPFAKLSLPRQLSQLQGEMAVLAEQLTSLISSCSAPFLHSIQTLVVEGMAPCLEEHVSPEEGATTHSAVSQLRRQVEHFRSHYYVAFRSMGDGVWVTATNQMMQQLFARLVALTVLRTGPSNPSQLVTARNGLRTAAQSLAAVLPGLVDRFRQCGATRATLQIQATSKQLEALLSTLCVGNVWLIGAEQRNETSSSGLETPGPTAIATAENTSSSSSMMLSTLLYRVPPLIARFFLAQQLGWEIPLHGQAEGRPTTEPWPANLLRCTRLPSLTHLRDAIEDALLAVTSEEPQAPGATERPSLQMLETALGELWLEVFPTLPSGGSEGAVLWEAVRPYSSQVNLLDSSVSFSFLEESSQ